ncbi:MAG: 5-formyltetrahydrofolate cyclo-ligase [Gammaproteobacteria bacterium]|nr:5-formyltetrahydrofolate cyclo-ligase [Gammaproteobacteria bacterium]
MPPRSEIRSRLRQQRRALSPAARATCAKQVARRFTASPLFRAARRIAFYWPSDGEIDITPILQRARAYGKTCYLPVLWRRNQLRFAACRAGDVLTFNRFGIPEPALPARKLVGALALDLILVPLVAFDAQGNRLGMGAGFYDRTLAMRARRTHWRRPRLIGVAYDFQKVAKLAPAPWDVPLDGVVTQLQWHIITP